MRQRPIDIHDLRTKVFKLKSLLLPEGLARQTRRHLAGIDGQRLAIAQPIATQGGNFLAIHLNQPALGRLNGRQPQANPY